MKQYQDILKNIMDNGIIKNTRNGKVKSLFGLTFRHNMQDGFPLLTTKEMYWKGIVTELLWFLAGDTNIKYLVDNNCHIWDGDVYKNYLKDLNRDNVSVDDPNYILLSKEEFINKIKTDKEFAKQWGELGPIYGKQWRNWNGIDQISNLINDLKINPDSRRIMVNAWNVDEVDQMVLPPCHYGFQVYTREMSTEEQNKWYFKLDQQNAPTRTISLMWNQRSVDTFLGLPFNIASYALLLEIIAKEVNMIPEHLIGSLGDCHIYEEHFEPVNEQLKREPLTLCKLNINTNVSILDNPKGHSVVHFNLEGYKSYSKIKGVLKN